jgi:hypothetical protein
VGRRIEISKYRPSNVASYVAAAICAVALIAPGAATAASVQVNSTADPPDTTSTDGICDIPPDGCTLRSALNAEGIIGDASNTITFAPGIGPTIALQGTAPLANFPANLTLQGPGASQLTIDGNANTSSFAILRDQPGQTSTISGLTVTGGHGTDFASGIEHAGGGADMTLDGVVVTGNTATKSGTSGLTAHGAGVGNGGALHLIRSTVSGNVATATTSGTNVGATAWGAGIFNDFGASLTLTQSTVSGNTATATNTDSGAGGVNTQAQAEGAGIFTFGAAPGTFSIDRSTISGNTSSATTNATTSTASSNGGGIHDTDNNAGASLTITSSTLTANRVQATSPSVTAVGGANLYSTTNGANETVKNSIFSAPVATNNSVPALTNLNCNSPVQTSAGHNLEDGNTCGFVGGTDQSNVAATGLDPNLASNGGATKTHALLPGSPAIDAGIASVGEGADQRGLSRPSDFASIPNFMGGDGSDIGAFEAQAPAPPVTNPPVTTPPATIPAAGPTGLRAAALKKCKKKHGAARQKCKKKAKLLPV